MDSRVRRATTGMIVAAIFVPAAVGMTVAGILLATAASARSANNGSRGSRARVWYVRASSRSGGTGSRGAPFTRLANVERVSRQGDEIVVLPSPLPLTGGIALKARQTLVGAGPAVTGSARHTQLPKIENTDRSRHFGDAVELANRTTVRNLVIGPAYRGGIYGADISRTTITGNDLSATNSSCTTGFVVQPFKLPALAPGVGASFSSGLPNGWAAIMVDERHTQATLRITRNHVHDSGCADGIDVRAMRTSRVSTTVAGNVLARLKQGSSQMSVLAIGMQTTDTARLDARLNANTETYIGNATYGDMGFADSEGLFANSAGRSRLIEHVAHNTFAHGLGHLSANCFEVVSSSGGPTMDVTLASSTCDHVVGDVLEAVNLSRDATMSFTVDQVRAAHSEFAAGPAFHQVEPGDDGVCLFELTAGARGATTVKVTHSLLTGCVTDGLEAASSVDDGTGPAAKLAFDVRDSRITGNTLSNLRVANSSPVARLDGRVARTDLGATPGTPIILENLDSTGGTHPRLDFGGGPLGSAGGNCIFGGGGVDVEAIREDAAARRDWWGQPGGPAAGQILTIGSSIDTSRPLPARPPGTC